MVKKFNHFANTAWEKARAPLAFITMVAALGGVAARSAKGAEAANGQEAYLKAQATMINAVQAALHSNKPVMWEGCIRFTDKGRPDTTRSAAVAFDSLEPNPAFREAPARLDGLYCRPIIINNHGEILAVVSRAAGTEPSINLWDGQISLKNKNLGLWEAISIGRGLEHGELKFYEQAEEGSNTIKPTMHKVRREGTQIAAVGTGWEWMPGASFMDGIPTDINPNGSIVSHLNNVIAGNLEPIPVPDFFKGARANPTNF